MYFLCSCRRLHIVIPFKKNQAIFLVVESFYRIRYDYDKQQQLAAMGVKKDGKKKLHVRVDANGNSWVRIFFTHKCTRQSMLESAQTCKNTSWIVTSFLCHIFGAEANLASLPFFCGLTGRQIAG